MNESQVLNIEEQSVILELGRETFGIDIGGVQESIRMTTITNLPGAPEFVEGVINLRGRIIPVVDLKRRFGLEQGEHTNRSRIVVVDVGAHTIGVVVDGVSEVLKIAPGQVEPPPAVTMTGDSDYIRGVAKLDDRMITLLDLAKALATEDLGELPKAA